MNRLSFHRATTRFGIIVVLCVLAIFMADSFAGPGGEIVEAVFKTRLGRIIFAILAIIFLPLILFYYFRLYRGIQKTRKDLNQLAEVYPYFQWELIQSRVKEAADVLYREWNQGTLRLSLRHLVPDYGQTQQDILDLWKEEGRQNVTELRKIVKVTPIQVLAQNWARPATVLVSVEMVLKDYLIDIATDKVIKGKKDFQRPKKILVMVYVEDDWKIQSIENDDDELTFAIAPNEVFTPVTLEALSQAPSQSPVSEAAEREAAAEEKKSVVPESTDRDHDR